MSLSPIPELSLLDKTPPKQVVYTSEELAALSELLEIKLKEFGVSARVISSLVGPVVTRFEVELAAGVKVNRVTKISQDLARSMSMTSLRVIPVIAGKPYIGIEVPNRHRQIVSLIIKTQTVALALPLARILVAKQSLLTLLKLHICWLLVQQVQENQYWSIRFYYPCSLNIRLMNCA